MKIKGVIRESVEETDKSVIVEFVGDDLKQHFEVHCNFSPFAIDMQKWDTWIFSIKWKSEIFTEPKTGKKSYFTHLICDKAEAYHQSRLTEKSKNGND